MQKVVHKMNILSYGALAALLTGVCTGATLKPNLSVAQHAQQAPRLNVDQANTGLLASAELFRHRAG